MSFNPESFGVFFIFEKNPLKYTKVTSSRDPDHINTLNMRFCGKVMFSCFQQSMALSEKRWRHTQKAAKKKNISECWLAWVSWNLCPCSLDWGYQSPFCGETWPVCICQIPFLPAQLKRLQRPTQLCQLWSWWTPLVLLPVPSHHRRRLFSARVK